MIMINITRNMLCMCFRRKSVPLQARMIDKYFAFGLANVSKTGDKDFSAHMNRKAVIWCLRLLFPPVGSPDRADQITLKRGMGGAGEGSGPEM